MLQPTASIRTKSGMHCSHFMPMHQQRPLVKQQKIFSALLCIFFTQSNAFLTPTRPKVCSTNTSSMKTLETSTIGMDEEIPNTRQVPNANIKSLPHFPVPIHSCNCQNPVAQESVPEDALPITILALCWGVTFISSLDRVAMSIAMIPLSEELGFPETMKGQVSSMFSIGYGLSILPAGILLSRNSPRLVMGIGMGLWSLATLITPLTASSIDSMSPLLITRTAVGAAESVVLPSLQRILSAWIPSNLKSVATAVVSSGFQAGTIAAYFVSPYVVDMAGNWRGLFIVFGGIGLLYIIPWLTLALDSPTLVPSEVLQSRQLFYSMTTTFEDSQQSRLSTPMQVPIVQMLSSRGVQGMIAAHAASNWGTYILLAWAPTFYAEQYGLTMKESSFMSVLPSLAGAFGGFVAGMTADAWIRREQSKSDERLTRIRKVFQSIALLGPASILAILAWSTPHEASDARSLLTGVIGLQSFNTAGYGPATQEKANGRWTGLLYSVTSLPGVIAGSIGVLATGQILEVSNHNWGLVFSVNAVIDVLGASAFALLYNATQEFD